MTGPASSRPIRGSRKGGPRALQRRFRTDLRRPLDGVLFATLPGVPAEMRRMFEKTLEPLIRDRSEGLIVTVVLEFAGISEEELGDEIGDLLFSCALYPVTLVGVAFLPGAHPPQRSGEGASTQRQQAKRKLHPLLRVGLAP